MIKETMKMKGTYFVDCRDAQGNLKWSDHIDNLVVTVAKNLTLDTILSGSSYTVTGPYMSLITSSGYSAIAAADTMASHAGWAESTAYSGTRKTCVFSSASAGAKALSAGLVFTFTGSDTIKGCFIVFGPSASSTVSNTSGTLLSAGLFTGGDKVVAPMDTLTVSYSLAV